MNRREFLKGFAAAGAGLALGGRSLAASPETSAKAEFHVFSKEFQPPVCADFAAISALMAEAGIDGIEWTVRGHGHIKPENAARDLPRAVEAARKCGLKSTLIVAAIKDASTPAEQDLLRICADCGVERYRPEYFRYERGETLRQTLDRVRRGFESHARACEKLGLMCCYQNHSGGNFFGGSVWDLHEVLAGIDPRYVSLEFDPLHARFQMNSSWEQTVDLIADRIGVICLKDSLYRFDPSNPKEPRRVGCRAGEGVMDWELLARLLKRNNVQAPFSLHFEYAFDKKDLRRAVAEEVDFFRRIF